jgi:hypothetical protein
MSAISEPEMRNYGMGALAMIATITTVNITIRMPAWSLVG